MSSNFFAEQNFLFQSIVTIEEQRKKLNELAEYFKVNEEGYEDMLHYVASKRQLKYETIKESGAFFINEDTPIALIPEEYQHESYGLCRNNRVMYAGRCVFPVYDVKGDIMGFCGWDSVLKPKYLDSMNYGYKAKRNCFYGMERLNEYYNNSKPVIVVEGLFDCLLLRELGLQSFAMLGSMLSYYVVIILKRFGNRLIVIPDNDNYEGLTVEETAGEGFVNQVFRKLPEARVFQTVNFKDLNDCWRDEEHKQYLETDLKNIGSMLYSYKELRQRANGRRKRW